MRRVPPMPFIPLLRSCLLLAAMAVALTALAPAAMSASRVKDISDFEGIRENQLVGYGLVVGLQGTGDGLRNSPFTRQSLQAMLERLGVNTAAADLNTNNVAAVMVTANLPPSQHRARVSTSPSAHWAMLTACRAEPCW